MAHSISARKRVRQNLVARARNRWRLRIMREAVKAFRDKVAHGTVDEAAFPHQASSVMRRQTSSASRKFEAAARIGINRPNA